MSVRNLNDFYNTVKSGGVRLGHQYQVNVTGTPVDEQLKDIQIWATTMTFPNVTQNAADINYMGYLFSLPTNFVFGNETTMTIRSDQSMAIHSAFLQWMNYHSQLDIENDGNGGGEKRFPNSNIEIQLLDEQMKNIKSRCVLIGAFPTSIGEMSLSQESAEPVTFDVSFRFQYWRNEDLNSAPFAG